MIKKLQQYLNEVFPTKEDKKDLRALSIDENTEADIQSDLKKIEGGELDLSEFSNLEELSIDGQDICVRMRTFKINHNIFAENL